MSPDEPGRPALSEGAEPKPQPFVWISRELGRPVVGLENKDALHSLLDR
jgi:hypothetical protein